MIDKGLISLSFNIGFLFILSSIQSRVYMSMSIFTHTHTHTRKTLIYLPNNFISLCSKKTPNRISSLHLSRRLLIRINSMWPR